MFLQILQWISIYNFATVSADNLLLVQAVWRHGDRTPIGRFPCDPNMEDAWPQGFGQLTPLGMEQQVALGQLMYDEYVTRQGFLSDRYNAKEIYVRSTDVNRTMISAISNMIGMYFNRSSEDEGLVYPSKGVWPRGFVPIAVHTVDDSTDHIGNPNAICPRQKWLWSLVEKTPEFIKIKTANQELMDNLTRQCKTKIDATNLWGILDAITIEKSYNKTTIDVSDENLAKIVSACDQLFNFQNGLDISPYNGIDFSIELPKIRGGSQLWAIIDHIDLKLHCIDPESATKEECEWMGKLKYYAFSAHDTTILALLTVLGAKKAVIPTGNPHYSAAIVFELWNLTSGPALKINFHRDFDDAFEVITNKVNGCEMGTDFCEYSKFRERAKIFDPVDIEKLCQITNAVSALERPSFFFKTIFAVIYLFHYLQGC